MSLVVMFLFGYAFGARHGAMALGEWLSKRQEVSSLQEALETVESELAVYRHGNDVERQASEYLRNEIIHQQRTIIELERAVEFFRSLVAPRAQAQGLTVHSLSISPSNDTDRFDVEVLVVQPLESTQRTSAQLLMSITGVQNGRSLELDWQRIGQERPMSLDFSSLGAFRFNIQLPPDFLPERVRLSLSGHGLSEPLRVEYPWEVKSPPHTLLDQSGRI